MKLFMKIQSVNNQPFTGMKQDQYKLKVRATSSKTKALKWLRAVRCFRAGET